MRWMGGWSSLDMYLANRAHVDAAIKLMREEADRAGGKGDEDVTVTK